MRKHLYLLSTVCVLLTSCDNYTSSQPNRTSGQPPHSSTDTRDTRDMQVPGGQPPVGPYTPANPDLNRNNPREQGRNP